MKVSSGLRRVYKSQLIEIIVPAGTTRTKFQFPDEQNLRYSFFMGFAVYDVETMPLSVLSTTDIVTLAQIRTISVTFQAYGGENFSWQTPAIAYANIGTAGTTQQFSPRVFAGQLVNWPKSYIELTDASLFPPAPDPDRAFLIEAFYKNMTKQDIDEAKTSYNKRS